MGELAGGGSSASVGEGCQGRVRGPPHAPTPALRHPLLILTEVWTKAPGWRALVTAGKQTGSAQGLRAGDSSSKPLAFKELIICRAHEEFQQCLLHDSKPPPKNTNGVQSQNYWVGVNHQSPLNFHL